MRYQTALHPEIIYNTPSNIEKLQKIKLKLQNKFSLIILFLFMSNINADYEVATNSGIAQGYKKNNIVYWDDIP